MNQILSEKDNATPIATFKRGVLFGEVRLEYG